MIPVGLWRIWEIWEVWKIWYSTTFYVPHILGLTGWVLVPYWFHVPIWFEEAIYFHHFSLVKSSENNYIFFYLQCTWFFGSWKLQRICCSCRSNQNLDTLSISKLNLNFKGKHFYVIGKKNWPERVVKLPSISRNFSVYFLHKNAKIQMRKNLRFML